MLQGEGYALEQRYAVLSAAGIKLDGNGLHLKGWGLNQENSVAQTVHVHYLAIAIFCFC